MVLSPAGRSRGQIRLPRPSGIPSGGVIARKDVFWSDFKQIQFSEWLDSVAVPFPGRSRCVVWSSWPGGILFGVVVCPKHTLGLISRIGNPMPFGGR